MSAYTALSTLAAAVAAAAGQSGKQTDGVTDITAVGALEHNKRLGPPRIVWVPRRGKITPPEQDEADTSRSAYQRRLECSVFILGSSFANAESLLNTWGAALFKQTQRSCRPTAEEHRDETLSGTNRYEIEITVEVDIPLLWDTYTPAPVDTVAVNTTVTN